MKSWTWIDEFIVRQRFPSSTYHCQSHWSVQEEISFMIQNCYFLHEFRLTILPLPRPTSSWKQKERPFSLIIIQPRPLHKRALGTSRLKRIKSFKPCLTCCFSFFSNSQTRGLTERDSNRAITRFGIKINTRDFPLYFLDIFRFELSVSFLLLWVPFES
jgi:hypothetical protein